MTRSFRLVPRVLLASALFPFAGASSCDAGDRAITGGCPEGEVCDPITEDGLHFKGATFGEALFDFGDVKTLAVGGRQDVTVFDVDDEGRHVALELPFTPDYDGTAIAIENQRDNVVTLRGVAGGDGFLRIVSADSGELFDRTPVAALPVVAAEVSPTLTVALDVNGGGQSSNLFTAGAVGYIALDASNGGSLVDEDATIAGPGITQTDWDRFTVGDLAPGTHQLTVAAGDTTRTVNIRVARADEVRLILGDDPDVPPEGEGSSFICFGARSAGRAIHAAWRFAVDFGKVERTEFEGCVLVSAGSKDAVTVRAYAGDAKLEVVVPVYDPSAKRTPRTLVEQLRARGITRLTTPETAGDRAAMRR